jgi:hypothetical protein
MPDIEDGFIEVEEGVRLYFRAIGRGEVALIPQREMPPASLTTATATGSL